MRTMQHFCVFSVESIPHPDGTIHGFCWRGFFSTSRSVFTREFFSTWDEGCNTLGFLSRGFSHHDATLGRVFCTSGNYVGFSLLGVFHIRMQHSVEFFGTSGNVTLRNLMKSVARFNARWETFFFHSKLSCVPLDGHSNWKLGKGSCQVYESKEKWGKEFGRGAHDQWVQQQSLPCTTTLGIIILYHISSEFKNIEEILYKCWGFFTWTMRSLLLFRSIDASIYLISQCLNIEIFWWRVLQFQI
jgi:hypothetical protein